MRVGLVEKKIVARSKKIGGVGDRKTMRATRAGICVADTKQCQENTDVI